MAIFNDKFYVLNKHPVFARVGVCNYKEDYINDNISEYKGVILHYTHNESPYYVYAPFMLNNLESLIEKCGAGKIRYVIFGDKLIFKLNSDSISSERAF